MTEGIPLSGVEGSGERALVDRAKQGEQAACRLLVEQHESAVAATVIGMLGAGDEADDVGQETFIRFFNSLDRFRFEASVRTYLQRIAINLSLNALKRRKRGVLRFLNVEEAGESAPAMQVQARSGNDEQEIREVVHAALDRLPPKHRPVVVLRMIEGYSTRETAELLGIPEGTVLSRLARAMDQLRGLLGPYMEGEES